MKVSTTVYSLLILFSLTVLCGCKKEEKESIPQVHWVSPEAKSEFRKGDTVLVSAYFSFNDNIQSITAYLQSPESDLNKKLHFITINDIASKIDFSFIINTSILESQLELNLSVESDAGVNNYKKKLNINGDSIQSSFGLVKILKGGYGKFSIQKLNENLALEGSEFSFEYEYNSSLSMSNSLYVSTTKTGGLIKINSEMQSEVLLQNAYGAEPFIISMAESEQLVYIGISSPSNHIIGFNKSGTETIRIGLQLDISEEILPIDDLIYSIERPTNGGSFIIANYNQRAGGYISSQNITRLSNDPHLFDFGEKKQVYFYFNTNDGKVQIERLSQSDNNISIIDKIEGVCLDQKPLKVSNSEVLIPLQNNLYLFTSNHEKNNVYSSNEKILAVRMNAFQDRIAILTNNSIRVLSYPSLQEISKTNLVEDAIDIQFMD